MSKKKSVSVGQMLQIISKLGLAVYALPINGEEDERAIGEARFHLSNAYKSLWNVSDVSVRGEFDLSEVL
jgi:hypothetical protein